MMVDGSMLCFCICYLLWLLCCVVAVEARKQGGGGGGLLWGRMPGTVPTA